MKINFIRNILILLFINFLNLNLYSQSPFAAAKIDKNNILIGDHIHLSLQVTAPKEYNVQWHWLTDSIGSLNVLNISKIDTVDTNGKRLYRQRLTITSFEAGSFIIPPIYFYYSLSGDTTKNVIYTNQLEVVCRTVAIDTTQAIKDIKAPFEEPITLGEYIWYIAIGVGILAAAYLFWYFWKKRKPKLLAELGYDPRIPPHVIALEALKQLDAEKLWQKGLVKQYHVRLTEIIRTYLERRFLIPALEETTMEIMDSIRSLGIRNVEIGVQEEQQIEATWNVVIDTELFNRINIMLELADLVKFAKVLPLPDENAASLKTAFDVVYRAIPVEQLEKA